MNDAPTEKRKLSTIDDYRRVVNEAWGSADVARSMAVNEFRPVPTSVVERLRICEDFLDLLDKLEVCRNEIGATFERNKATFRAKGIGS